MELGEHETVINFDYAYKLVYVYTTREGVANGIRRRLGQQDGVIEENVPRAWRFTIPMALCRGGEMIVKLLNPEEREPMSEEQKARFKAAA